MSDSTRITPRAINSITAVEQYRGKEMNPFVNPGAIATVGNVKGNSPDEVWAKILQFHSDCAGRQLDVNQPVYKSESDTNQRNRAISALMSAYERFPMDPAVAVDLYTRQCSINVSAHDLAVMGATLAFGGRNQVTGKQVLDRSHVPGLLAIMSTAMVSTGIATAFYPVIMVRLRSRSRTLAHLERNCHRTASAYPRGACQAFISGSAAGLIEMGLPPRPVCRVA